jgi:hypothetical protein
MGLADTRGAPTPMVPNVTATTKHPRARLEIRFMGVLLPPTQRRLLERVLSSVSLRISHADW